MALFQQSLLLKGRKKGKHYILYERNAKKMAYSPKIIKVSQILLKTHVLI